MVETVELNRGVLQECQEKKLKNPYISDAAFVPKLIGDYLFNNIVTFNGICLKQSYELDIWSKDLNIDFTLGNCLFGAIKLVKNVDPDKYKNSGYGIGFDFRPEFFWTDGSVGKMFFWVNCILKWFVW